MARCGVIVRPSRNRHDYTTGFEGPSKRGAEPRTGADVEEKVMHEQITHAKHAGYDTNKIARFGEGPLWEY
jgi:hypothetical protein